ncbi:hypothetical protein SAMN04487905_101402 [Actinopolyspora xinjiangensis]|uniref:Methyltransferase domain-containing protein n=2 Tax=Actinopolyspora xinjiangensis TaxID=405564 RepID=A0A1H0P5S1_9ACTN|nr:hypothetical protein SAMN04487905_101402 [Actinopolyspora xinjiangensis]
MLQKNFFRECKTNAQYLDLATNAHGDEKGLLLHRALDRIQRSSRTAVEVGPGGGAAVSYLASALDVHDIEALQLTLIEAPGVESRSLAQSIDDFNRAGGSCVLKRGLVEDIDSIIPEPVDVISASALLHEVYSYSGAYSGLHAVMRALPTMLRYHGYFVYRDVYAVESPSLHDRTVQSYDSLAWLQFIRMFVPHYLREGTHPYHHAADDMVVRQNSRIVPIDQLDVNSCASIVAPVGVFREIQRHYVTLRDHVWRSGVLGFKPYLEGQLAHDWVDFKRGHKRVHYTLTGTDWLSHSQQVSLLAMSEVYADHYTIDSDILDEVTDVALTEFLIAAMKGDESCSQVWSSWLAREGRESYAYMTLDDLLAEFAVSSADSESRTVLMPVQAGDIARVDRNYYNRFLRKRLATPLVDAKQLVLFQNVPCSDESTLRRAMEAIQHVCGKQNLARIYTAMNSRRSFGYESC